MFSSSDRLSFLRIAVPLLLWADLLNFLFEGTPLAAWKQGIVVYVWVRAFNLTKGTRYFAPCAGGLATTLLLVVWSLYQGVDLDIALYNAFLYLSWLPCFIVGAGGGYDELTAARRSYWLVFVALSVLGLYLDFATPLFSFIDKQGEVGLLIQNAIARRASFFFVASTMAIPLVGFMLVAHLRTHAAAEERLLPALLIVLAAFPTGSVSAMVVALIVALVLLAGLGLGKGAILALGLACSLFVTLSIDGLLADEGVQLQIERLIENQHPDSVSNLERRGYWDLAWRDIGRMDPSEIVLGMGLGTTNDNRGNPAPFINGESSFLQAMIECGLLGVLTRLLPFLLLFRYGLAVRRSSEAPVIVAWGAANLWAVAIAPTFGSISFQMALGLLIGRLFVLSRSAACPDSCST